jgi:hypothetical protein
MQFQDDAKKDARCLNTAANAWISTMQLLFGQVAIDNTRAAKIALQGSLREIAATEEELKAEMDTLIVRVRATQRQTKNIERVKPILIQCRKIKNRLLVLQRKKEALETHMETLENSELNQHVLHSMQRTSNALKAMGLDKNLQSVDKVMLDLEENHNDVNSIQQSLGVGYGDEDDVDWGSELSLLLSDDCMLAPPVHNSMPSSAQQVSVPLPAAVSDDVATTQESVDLDLDSTDVKKEDAPVQVTL